MVTSDVSLAKVLRGASPSVPGRPNLMPRLRKIGVKSVLQPGLDLKRIPR